LRHLFGGSFGLRERLLCDCDQTVTQHGFEKCVGDIQRQLCARGPQRQSGAVETEAGLCALRGEAATGVDVLREREVQPIRIGAAERQRALGAVVRA
jgi:hypothetical protein